MDYEKKYNEALERAREYKKYDNMMINVALDNIFPELKESEDEKIRKAIIYGLKYLERELSWDALDDVDILDAYDWLEKQGESYTKKDIDDAYLKGVCDAKQELEKQGKQIFANSCKICKKSQRRITDNKRKLL